MYTSFDCVHEANCKLIFWECFKPETASERGCFKANFAPFDRTLLRIKVNPTKATHASREDRFFHNEVISFDLKMSKKATGVGHLTDIEGVGSPPTDSPLEQKRRSDGRSITRVRIGQVFESWNAFAVIRDMGTDENASLNANVSMDERRQAIESHWIEERVAIGCLGRHEQDVHSVLAKRDRFLQREVSERVVQLAGLSRCDLDSGNLDALVRFQSQQSQDVRGFDLPSLVLSDEAGRLIVFVIAWNCASGSDRTVFVMVVPHPEMCDLFRSASFAQPEFETDFASDVVSQIMPAGGDEQFWARR